MLDLMPSVQTSHPSTVLKLLTRTISSAHSEDGSFSDLKIVSNDGKEFNVHKLVLCSMSKFFRAACTVEMKEKAENRITLPESSAVIETILQFCYSGGLDPAARKATDGRHMSHWAEVYVAAIKYRFEYSYDRTTLRSWALGFVVDCMIDAEKRLIDQHSGLVDASFPEASAEEKALWEQTDFDDLVRAVDILLDNTLEDDDVYPWLIIIEWGVFALADRRAALVSLVDKYPGYFADLVAKQSTERWEGFYTRLNKRREKEAAKENSAVMTELYAPSKSHCID